MVLVCSGVSVWASNYCYIGQTSGWLTGTGDFELAQLSLRGGVSYQVSVTVPWRADFDVMILDDDGDIVATGTSGGIGVTEYVSFRPTFGGTYYLAVYSYRGSGSYTATLRKRC
jgi:serine protease AprX